MKIWQKLSLSALSGILLTLAMPGFDVPYIGWVALVPLLVTISISPPKEHYLLALPFGLVFSWGVHNWYPNIFPPTLGYFLIFAVGTFYAAMLHLGAWLQGRLNGWLKLLAFPVAWTAIEFVKFIAPVVEDWWFVLLAKSAWRFPAALQVLSVGGFPALSFIIMLANVAIAGLIIRRLKIGNQGVSKRASISAIIGIVVVLVWGAISSLKPPARMFTIAALTDMVNQDPDILAASEFSTKEFGTAENTPEVSQKIFDLDAKLTRSIRGGGLIIWPENEFANADDAQFMDQLKDLAVEVDSYIVADVVWHAKTGMHDTALMVSPEGEEVGRRAKINTTDGEENMGFVPGQLEYPVFNAPPFGKVGLGVCWDRHRIYITRELARSGADIVLMTVDDDFDASTTFPPFHASDSVFRAAENRVAFATGTTSGISMVIDPYGRIAAEGEINERGVILGNTFTAPGQTFYTRYGNWFGWLMVVGLIFLAAKRK